jgi:hypothetical protein
LVAERSDDSQTTAQDLKYLAFTQLNALFALTRRIQQLIGDEPALENAIETAPSVEDLPPECWPFLAEATKAMCILHRMTDKGLRPEQLDPNRVKAATAAIRLSFSPTVRRKD